MQRVCLLILGGVAACRPSSSEPAGGTQPEASSTAQDSAIVADILDVEASGSSGAFNLSVTLRSPDTGCAQYANWWEALDEDGGLLYRRILGHSHVDEQPFTRSGGPVPVEEDTPMFIRAHMNTGGYGGVVFGGTVRDGFEARPDVEADFAANVESLDPQPTGCAF